MQEEDDEYGDEKGTTYGEEDENDEEDEEEDNTKANIVMTKEEQAKYPYMQIIIDLLENLKQKNP
jgi:hypothetical protein